ncbi:MAG TPA: hypothetical protein O0W91_04545, partial [Methanocorpusculum sp.]|nr:hypothetical protein [Methanocorpusculum sp.]
LVYSLPPDLVVSIAAGVNEFDILRSAQEFLERESALQVDIVAAEPRVHPKGYMALPFKPAILIE